MANASYVSITNVTIFGSDNIFAVFFAGADVAAGQPTLDNFAYRNNMDSYNSFTNSVVESAWSGDSLSFSLQHKGILRNNTVTKGGKIAFYMNAKCICSNNVVINSTSQGIYVSSPSVDNIFVGNKILNSK